LSNSISFIYSKRKRRKYKEQKSQMRSAPGKIRSTVLEGSFGNEKTHYGIDQIKARTEANEKAWIFFRLLTGNAVQIAQRMQAVRKQKKAA
jgi:CRISPR/Cas system CMR-associated protein Cmr5 small subunit